MPIHRFDPPCRGPVGLLRQALVLFGLILLALSSASVGTPGGPAQALGPVHVLTINGGIGPATTDYIRRGLADAAEAGAAAVVLQIDTPGGLDAATRDINKAILASSVPVIAWVAPEGARAASAGTYILYACHLAAMAPATVLGAATPVSLTGAGSEGDPGSGRTGAGQPEAESDGKSESGDYGRKTREQDEPGREGTEQSGRAMERKVINDAVAYLRGLAELRGRSVAFAEAAVREARTLTASEAVQQGVVELIAVDIASLLEQADGRAVSVLDQDRVLATAGAVVQVIEPDWRSRLLSVITDPSVAYLLLLVGLYGLVFEGYSPGAVLPGVIGAIALLLALYALQVLPVNYVGVLLIVLGVVLMAFELMAPSFGVLGIGGVIALVAGSLLLFDTDVPGFGVPGRLVLGVGFASGLMFLAVLALALRARTRPVGTGAEALLGAIARVESGFPGRGLVRVNGEVWQAVCDQALPTGVPVEVCRIEGLTLHVAPTSAARSSPASERMAMP